MKKIGSVVLCCFGVAAFGGAAAMAADGNGLPNQNQAAAEVCTSELHVVGVKQFKLNHGNGPKHQHAMRNCMRDKRQLAGNIVNNASQQCRAEQADPTTIPSNTSGLTFDEFYGTNQNQRNAFGQCVSGKVQAAEDQIEQNLQNAAQKCRAERKDPTTIPGNTSGMSFTDWYGKNKNKRNAFGKCVSQKAKAQGSAPAPTT